MRVSEIIREELAQWGNDWVHYTNHPMLAINPKPSHMDPAGIYFFPASVVPGSEMWHNMRYRFTVNIRPDARLLDIARCTEQQIWQLIDTAGIRDSYTKYITDHPPKDLHKMFDMAWEWLQRHYFLDLYHKPAAFNAMLRSVGYQGIFDDTGSIHSGERQQLLVLDPRIIMNVRMTQQKSGSFAAVQKVVEDLKALGSRYGNVQVAPIRRPNQKTSYYADLDKLLICRVEVNNPQNEDNYASFQVAARKDRPDLISISLSYSNPRLNYGVGTEYSIGKQQYAWKDISELSRELDQIFAPQQPVAEVKKLPGPQVVGSGKDFRVKPGGPKSGKIPGPRLMGSGKPMKVRKGFVGSG